MIGLKFIKKAANRTNKRYKARFFVILKNIKMFFWAILIVFFEIYLDDHNVNFAIPFLPLSTIGMAAVFYLGFKNNAAYDRFWEARKIWGMIVNYSRS